MIIDLIRELCKIDNNIDFIYESIDEDDIKDIIEDYINIKICQSRKIKKYHQSEKGKIAVREASKRYYYRKNDIHHEIYNPEGDL